MQHNCNNNGCFLKQHVLKFGFFDGIFPNGINFSDIDGTLEYRYQFLEMEWKSYRGGFDAVGQRKAIERKTTGYTPSIVGFKPSFTKEVYAARKAAALRISFILVVGLAADMSVHEYKIMYNNKRTVWIKGNFDDLKVEIELWRDYVDRRPDQQGVLLWPNPKHDLEKSPKWLFK